MDDPPDDPLDDGELRVAKRLLEDQAAARGLPGLDLAADRLHEAVDAGGAELRLAIRLIRALDLRPDRSPRPPLDAADGDPAMEPLRANLARLGAALPPTPPPLSAAEAAAVPARCEAIAARHPALAERRTRAGKDRATRPPPRSA